MAEKFGYDKITVDRDGIHLDNILLDAYKVGHMIDINQGGGDIAGPVLTLTIYADEIVVTIEAMKAVADGDALINVTTGN